jgi:hypothetical protein
MNCHFPAISSNDKEPWHRIGAKQEIMASRIQNIREFPSEESDGRAWRSRE